MKVTPCLYFAADKLPSIHKLLIISNKSGSCCCSHTEILQNCFILEGIFLLFYNFKIEWILF
ncbi:hypothetical protein [African swine fever virus]|uniref:Uncharacterized protein n=1 Tax=African swine fever virus TaxID=10497 RepID=A0A3G1EV49_ASF|nr:hypothetical protein F8221_gp138 [African swine fever virus]AOO54443.1 hypothetical protein AFSV47Ss_0138 [African swine fever virus]QID21268.1 hypothetical protein AFSV47Ss_0138 [African swine fever virus]QIM06779.1 hypothetical protein [African swine fever virus]QIM07014.1 hypothetical protein [African swine fever virus]QIM07249.1 hypothetical protein [African swine fever virus]